MSETPHNEVHVQSHMRMNFYGPVFLLIGTPFALICVFVFCVFTITHWSALVALSPIIIYGVAGFVGVVLFSLGAWLVNKFLIHPSIKSYHLLGEAHGAHLRSKVLHTDNNYTIIFVGGEPKVVQVTQEKFNYNIRGGLASPEGDIPLGIEGPKAKALPAYVRYEDVKPQIPQGHALVGISERGVETKEKKKINALIWFVGGSGTGKTNSVTLRVEEDEQANYRFLVIDPHIFKEDSLYNAIKGYESRFLLPVASEPEDILRVLNFFLDEFEQRKAGATWSFPIRVIVDEVGSLVSDIDKDDRIEVEIVRKLKEVARVCGQESRGFEMGGMFISQDAAGLAWLRKRALMVVAHQMMMWSERLLVCNQNTEVARDMDTWPIGRTLIYGIGFDEGQRVFQQPVHSPRVVDANPPRLEDLSFRETSNLNNGKPAEATQEAYGSRIQEKNTDEDLSTIKNLREIGKRLKKGELPADIVKSYGLPYGRATQELRATVDMVLAQIEQEEM